MEPASDQCAYYFTRERVANLQIRASLQQLTGSQLVAGSPRGVDIVSGGREEEVPLVPLSNSALPPPESTSAFTQHSVIKWQQKLLSPCEMVEYSRPVFADDPQHKTLHEQAIKLKRRKKRKSRIFTYQHQDNYQYQNQQGVSTSKRLEPKSLLRQRKTTASFKNIPELNSEETSEGLHTTETRRKKKGDEDASPQQHYFYIMADLAPVENLGETRTYEVVLCALKYDAQGQLTVTPDFTRPGTKPYRLESYGVDNAQYEYKIENVSPTRSSEERQQEDQLAEQLAQQRIEEVDQLVGMSWGGNEERGEGEVRLVVMGEITRALHFHQASSLYIHYVLYLPPGWRCNSGGESEGLTPSCAMTYVEDVATAHYSTPFHLDLTRHHSGTGWPMLLLAAYSLDWLGRDRDEGYASYILPTPGEKDRSGGSEGEGVETVAMWRPALTSPLDKMRRFFLGGCQLITDLTYLALPASTQVERVSRLGFSTVSSGSIELRANSLVQADFTDTDYGVLLENPPGWQISTLAVIDAFNRSRQKLRAAKEGLVLSS